jgi:hypothetical protein
MAGVLAQDQAQVPLAGDQHPVQALAAGAADPALRDRVRARRPHRGLDNSDPSRRQYRVEGSGELRVPVPDQVILDLAGAGSIPAPLRIFQTVDGASLWPSPASSPWMRR